MVIGLSKVLYILQRSHIAFLVLLRMINKSFSGINDTKATLSCSAIVES